MVISQNKSNIFPMLENDRLNESEITIHKTPAKRVKKHGVFQVSVFKIGSKIQNKIVFHKKISSIKMYLSTSHYA